MSEQKDIVPSPSSAGPSTGITNAKETITPLGNPCHALRISLSASFRDGDIAGPFFYDYFTIPESDRLRVHEVIRDFRARVMIGAALRGKNKPSWEDDGGATLPHTEGYQELNYWHYHCGPSWKSSPYFSPTYGLQRNIYGDTSAEVIHYRKVLDAAGDVAEIVIVGYSPEHIPFLPSDDPHQPNEYFPPADED